MSAKHTPGSWVFDDTAQPDPIRITTADRMRNRKAPIAQVDCDYSEPFASEQRANLQLIAAAPDLLEALRKLSFAAQTSGGTAGRDETLVAAIDHASAIIAKATGAPQ